MQHRPDRTEGRPSRFRCSGLPLQLALACALSAGLAGPAHTEEPETWRAVGTLVAYDRASQTLAVRGQSSARVYKVRRSGPLATRVSWNAQPATLEQIPRGAPVELRWRRDPSGRRVVRWIEGPLPEVAESVSH
jgi:hypothetical protein